MTALAGLRFAPLVPEAVLIGLAVVCLVLVGLAAWRRARGTLARALCLAAMLGWLAGPRLVEETRQALPDIAVLVVDHSASMAVGQRAALAEAARAELTRQAAGMAGLELREVAVPEAGRQGTQLFAALGRALAGIPRERLSAVVMLTDGQVADGPKALPAGVPLHVLLAARGEEVDRRVRLLEAPGWGIVGQTATLRYVVEDLGAPGGGLARVTLRRDGAAPQEGEVPVGVAQTLTVPVDHAGPEVVEIAAAPLAGEVSTANNSAVATLNGVRDRLRVLLVSGAPDPGVRAWRRLLKADPAVDLVHFTILRPPDRDDGTPLNELALIAFPTRELFVEKIRSFDLIVLDRFANRGILPPAYLANIADYVRGGGALLVTAGPEFAAPGGLATGPLAAVLPLAPAATGDAPAEVATGAFRPEVTATGARHPVTAELTGQAQWGAWYRRVVPRAARGEALLAAPGGDPLLLLDRVDKGRVALLLSDQIWLWARGHGDAQRSGGGPQAELLRRTAHWLMGEPELEEEALTARPDAGRLDAGGPGTEGLAVTRRSLAAGAPPEVTLTGPDGSTHRLALAPDGPGQASGRLAGAAPGVWQATDGTRSAFVAVAPPDPPEFADLRATATRLAPLARASGGSVHWLAAGVPRLERGSGGAGAIGLPRRGGFQVTGVAETPLLPPAVWPWAALVLILGLALLAWRREGA